MDADMEPTETNPLKDGALTENSKGIGTVTMKMIKDRAIEIAWTNGRRAHELKPADYVEANRDLTGQPQVEPNEEAIESAPESERWDPVPGSAGHKVAVPEGEDEDVEGRSDEQKLVDEGISEAESDQARQAAEDADKKDI